MKTIITKTMVLVSLTVFAFSSFANGEEMEKEPVQKELLATDLLSFGIADVAGKQDLVMTEPGTGLTAYMFAPDNASGASVCSGPCLATWPAITVSDELAVQVKAPFSVHKRQDNGQNQLVLNGHPLYTFAPDQKPGDAFGQGSGGVWFVFSPTVIK